MAGAANTNQHVMTVDEVAALWRVSSDIVRAEINRGHLRATRIGRLIRIRRDWVEEYELANSTPASSDRQSSNRDRPAPLILDLPNRTHRP